jgi:hypothetical protein
LTDHPGSLFPASIAQLTPPPAGKGSVTTNPVAVPALPLLKVTVNPIWEPALTLALSATLLIAVVAQRTASEAVASPDPSLSVVKLAVLL